MAAKVVVIGAVRGNFSIFTKLSKLQAKQNFSFALVVGDLFADPAAITKSDDGSFKADEDVQSLLDGRINIPLPTYFCMGNHALPAKVVEKLSQGDGELCSNLFFLGKRSTFKTSDGVRIVSLGGLLSTEVAENAVDEKYTPFHTELDAKSLNVAHNADILLTSSWPTGIRNGSKIQKPDDTPDPHSELCVADLVKTLKPRYHFCSSPDLFFEREPFFFKPQDNAPNDRPTTRFISLASPDSPTKAKWLYAFNLDLNSPVSTTVPPNATPAPFLSPSRLGKRDRGGDYHSQYRYSAHEHDAHNKSRYDKRRRGNRGDIRPPTQSECFFCLSNSTTATHLIGAIGDDVYLTTSKGPVPTSTTWAPYFSCPAQILIIPLAHSPTIASIPSSAGDNAERTNTYAEMLRFRKALDAMLAVKGEGQLGSVCWEINKQAGVHVHWQWMPLPVNMIRKNLVEAGLKVQAEGDGYATFEKKEVGDGVGTTGDWFRCWVWDPATDDSGKADGDGDGIDNAKRGAESVPGKEACWFLPLDPTQKFDLQFGRRVMAKLLDTPQRAHWKDVAQTTEEEIQDVDAFKKMFSKWDFTGTALTG